MQFRWPQQGRVAWLENQDSRKAPGRRDITAFLALCCCWGVVLLLLLLLLGRCAAGALQHLRVITLASGGIGNAVVGVYLFDSISI